MTEGGTPIQNSKSKIQNPLISLVAAMSINRVIGRGNRLPWHLSADLKHFKQLTMDHAVIMGRRTFESMECKPLPGRTNIVVTRSNAGRGAWDDSVIVARDLNEAIELATEHDRSTRHRNEIFIVGGSEIFRQVMPRADRVHLTLVQTTIADGDTYFPELDERQWKLTRDERHDADEKNPYAYSFKIYDRIAS